MWIRAKALSRSAVPKCRCWMFTRRTYRWCSKKFHISSVYIVEFSFWTNFDVIKLQKLAHALTVHYTFCFCRCGSGLSSHVRICLMTAIECMLHSRHKNIINLKGGLRATPWTPLPMPLWVSNPMWPNLGKSVRKFSELATSRESWNLNN
jgi:hypothetical protein